MQHQKANEKKYNNRIWVKSEEDDEEESEAGSEFMSYGVFTHVLTKLVINLDETVQPSKYYRNVIEHMSNLTEADKVTIKLNNYGGNLAGAISWINAIRTCEADVEVVINGTCISAASLIALAAPSISVMPYSDMMIHSATFGSYGKDGNVEANVKFISSKSRQMMNEIYKDFLTDPELSDVHKGMDIWLKADEIEARLQRRSEIQEQRVKKALKDQKKVKLVVKPSKKDIGVPFESSGGIVVEYDDSREN